MIRKKITLLLLCFVLSINSLCAAKGGLLRWGKKQTSKIIDNPATWFSKNAHTVENNALYRSAQPSQRSLRKAIRKDNIKTVLNLRGNNPDEKWYQDEVAITNEYNVKLISVSLSAKGLPTKENLERILDTFKVTQGPILVHCMQGADRTGLVSALWTIEKSDCSLKSAHRQQRLKYGHIKKRYPSMREFIKKWHDLKIKYKTTEAALAHYS